MSLSIFFNSTKLLRFLCVINYLAHCRGLALVTIAAIMLLVAFLGFRKHIYIYISIFVSNLHI